MKFIAIKEQKRHFQENIIIQKIREFTNVYAVVMNYSIQRRSLILALVGQVFMLQSIKTK
jgi:hypothetical protein